MSQRIRQAFNEATQNNVGGPNQWGGAKFAAVIAGNDQQARNLRAAVEVLHGPQFWDDFRQFLDVMEATGRRQAPGSGTEFNRQMATEMQKGGIVGHAAAVAVSPKAWPRRRISKTAGATAGTRRHWPICSRARMRRSGWR